MTGTLRRTGQRGMSEEALWEQARPWWRAAQRREPETVTPIIAAWERGGMSIAVTEETT